MKNIMLLLVAVFALCFTGCLDVRTPEPDDVAAAFSAKTKEAETAKANAAFATADATTWKASDAKKAQKIADQGKDIKQLQAASDKKDRDVADAVAERDQVRADLKQAVITQERYRAAWWCAATLLIAVAAYALSDYFTTFQMILRPIAYISLGVCAAAFIWRTIIPYVTSIESGLLILLGLVGIYELDIHTPVGNWFKWLLGKVEGNAEVAKVVTTVEASVAKVEAEVKKVL